MAILDDLTPALADLAPTRPHSLIERPEMGRRNPMERTMKAQVFTENDFDTEVLQSSQPVLVDFFAHWCAPCRVVGPIIDELAETYDGKLKVGKVDIDASGAIAQRYHIHAIPTLLVFKDGKVTRQLQGPQPKTRLAAVLDEALAT